MQRIDCTLIELKASAVIHDMPSTHMSAGRLRAAARHAARYLHAESNAAAVSRSAVPMDVGRVASDVGSTSQVSIGTSGLQNAPIYWAAVGWLWYIPCILSFCIAYRAAEGRKHPQASWRCLPCGILHSAWPLFHFTSINPCNHPAGCC